MEIEWNSARQHQLLICAQHHNRSHSESLSGWTENANQQRASLSTKVGSHRSYLEVAWALSDPVVDRQAYVVVVVHSLSFMLSIFLSTTVNPSGLGLDVNARLPRVKLLHDYKSRRCGESKPLNVVHR